MLIWPFKMLFRMVWRLAGRGPLQMPWGVRKVRDPDRVEMIPRKTVNPARQAKSHEVGHGHFRVLGATRKAVQCAVISESGGAKGQTVVNFVIRDQLQHSPEHLVILDVKGDLYHDVVRRYYSPEGDQLWKLTMHSDAANSSSIALFAATDAARARQVTQALTRPQDSSDPYWAKKAGALIASIATENGGSILRARDIVSDPLLLEAERERSRAVDSVADNTKEWGSIRSNAMEALVALDSDRVRRLVAGWRLPDFGAQKHRQIVVIQPDEDIAGDAAGIIAAAIDALYSTAAFGGKRGGPGTKFIIDEAASFMALESLPRYLELGRGSRVQLMYVLQSAAQLAAVLGRDQAARVLAATPLHLVGSTTDIAMAEELSKLSGVGRVHYRGPAEEAREGRNNWREYERALILPTEITDQKPGEWTVRQGSDIRKYRVPEKRYYYRQQHPPRQATRLMCVPKPADYMLHPPAERRRGRR